VIGQREKLPKSIQEEIDINNYTIDIPWDEFTE
jgi:hypothetical protein